MPGKEGVRRERKSVGQIRNLFDRGVGQSLFLLLRPSQASFDPIDYELDIRARDPVQPLGDRLGP
jgi:hypothetical protein